MQQRFNREELENIRAANPIETVAARYTDLKPAGRNRLKGRCPFHQDDTPSFMVYTDQQSWWCYGCEAGSSLRGKQDVFKFIMVAEKVSFPEAVRRLSAGVPQGSGRPLPKPAVKAAPPEPKLSEAHLHLITQAAQIYHTHLLAYPPALDYLNRRGLDMETILKYRIGYAAGDRLRKYLRFKGWDEGLAAELKLIEEKRGREHFRSRIIVPEWRGNKAVYLSGRALGSFNPKYLFLTGAPKPIYGLEAVKGQQEVYLTEGIFDWLTLAAWGYPAVCLLGTWLKKARQPAFDSFRRLYPVFDNDKAGKQATERLLSLWPERVKPLRLPDGVKDVGELGSRPDGQKIFAGLIP